MYQARSLFPRAHVGVNGHTVVGSIAQLLLADLGTGKGARVDNALSASLWDQITKKVATIFVTLI